MFLALLALIFSAVFVTVWFALPRIFSTDDWATTTGRVNVSEVEVAFRDPATRQREFRFALAYDYSVHGRSFQGDKVYPLLPHIFKQRGPAEDLRAQYPAGSQVTVYYRPASPEQACLVPQSLGSTGQRAAIGLVAALAATAIAAVFIFLTTKSSEEN